MSAISKIDGKLLADLTARARIKNILKEIEDIKKAIWYLNDKLKMLEK